MKFQIVSCLRKPAVFTKVACAPANQLPMCSIHYEPWRASAALAFDSTIATKSNVSIYCWYSDRSSTLNRPKADFATLLVIFSVGTQVVAQKEVMAADDRIAHPAGAVGVIVRSPMHRSHAYRVKSSDGFEAAILHDQLVRLSEFKRGLICDPDAAMNSARLYVRTIAASRLAILRLQAQ